MRKYFLNRVWYYSVVSINIKLFFNNAYKNKPYESIFIMLKKQYNNTLITSTLYTVKVSKSLKCKLNFHNFLKEPAL